MQKHAVRHPWEKRDLAVANTYVTKFLDTRPLDEDYKEYYKGGEEVRLGGVAGDRLVERLIAWRQYESIQITDIMDEAGIVAEDEKVYVASVRDSSQAMDDSIWNGLVNATRDLIETDDDYDEPCNELSGYVNSVCDNFQGCEVLDSKGIETGFVLSEDGLVRHTAESRSSHPKADNKECRLFSNRFRKKLVRRVAAMCSRPSTKKQPSWIDSVRDLFWSLTSLYGKTNSDEVQVAEQWIERIAEAIPEFLAQLPKMRDSNQGSHCVFSMLTPAHNEITEERLRNYINKAISQITPADISGNCNVVGSVSPEISKDEYNADELLRWSNIAAQVVKTSCERIDKTPDEHGNAEAKERMTEYVQALCNPKIDTIVCQGEAGSGKTFTAMLCGFLAMKEGLIEEILHTRPLVSAGGTGIGFEPGSVSQKLGFWSKPMADAFKRLDLDEALKDKVQAYPFDRIRGISMRPRTWLLGDEAQNMSYPLLQCMVNRTEKNSKFIATGDTSQSDMTFKKGEMCGLEMLFAGWKLAQDKEPVEVNDSSVRQDDSIDISVLRKSMRVVKLKNSIRNTEGINVRKWLQQLPKQLKDAAKITTGNSAINHIVQQEAKTLVPVFASFAGVDNLGQAVCHKTCLKSKFEFQVVGGSETDPDARAAFRRRNRFESFYENKSVTDRMLRGIYVLVSGAPCVAYSIAGAQRGRSSKIGMHYIEQVDAYVSSKIPVVILEQVEGVTSILPRDKVSNSDGKTPQQLVEDKFRAGGYHVKTKVINAADFGGLVNRERLITVAVRNDVWGRQGQYFKWPSATTPRNSHRRPRNLTVRSILDKEPSKRYLLPRHRMAEFIEASPLIGHSQAIKLWQRDMVYRGSERGIGNPYDPNSVYSLDSVAPSPTARGNSRYFEWEDEGGVMWFRRLSPLEMAKCMGVPSDLVRGLGDSDAYRLIGNSVSSALGNVLAPIAQSLVDDEAICERAASYNAHAFSSSNATRIRSQELDVVTRCMEIQMRNRIQGGIVSKQCSHDDLNTQHLLYESDKPSSKPAVSNLNEEGNVQTDEAVLLNLNEEGNGQADALPNLNEEGNGQTDEVVVLNPNEEGECLDGAVVYNVQESQYYYDDQAVQHSGDGELSLFDMGEYQSSDLPGYQVNSQNRINAITNPLGSALFSVVSEQLQQSGLACNFKEAFKTLEQKDTALGSSNITLGSRNRPHMDEVWGLIRDGQRSDPLIKAVHDYIQNSKDIPSEFGVKLRDHTMHCHVQDGIVYRIANDNYCGPSLVLWVPDTMQEETVKKLHYSCLACHPSPIAMESVLKRTYFWIGMKVMCERIFNICHTCNRAKRPPSKAKDVKSFVPISKPLSVVAIDVVGPMGNSKSATSKDNRFIISMIDWFTRFCVCYAVPNTTAETIADCLTKFTKRLGTPLTLISDNAKYFTDASLAQYERVLGIKHAFVATFRPEGNGMLERFHGSLGRGLKVRTADARSNNWDQELDSICFAYNIVEHGTTGYSPFFLIHGWHPTLPFDITLPAVEGQYQGYDGWVSAAAQRLRITHDHAYTKMTAAQVSRVKHNNSSKESLHKGDKVYLWVPAVPRHAIKKITMRWHGPYEVLSGPSGRSFRIRTQRGARWVHEQRIRKAWADNDFSVSPEDDDKFEDLLDDNGRVDAIQDVKRIEGAQEDPDTYTNVVMEKLLKSDPMVPVSEDNTTPADDQIVNVPIKLSFYRDASKAREETIEPAINDSVPVQATTQVDQIADAAIALTQGSVIAQFSLCCSQCQGLRVDSERRHHSVCWSCWFGISKNDESPRNMEEDTPWVFEEDIDSVGTFDISTMESEQWYRLSRPFQIGSEFPKHHSIRPCALCSRSQVLVENREINRYCHKSDSCLKAVARDNAFQWHAAGLYVKRVEDECEWSDDFRRQSVEAEDILMLKPLERELPSDITDCMVDSICGFTPSGSRFHVLWGNYDGNKKRGDPRTIQQVLNCERKVLDYILGVAGKKRMNRLRVEFHANANNRIKDKGIVKDWNYTDWLKSLKNEEQPHLLVQRVVAIKLVCTGSASHASLIKQLKDNRQFSSKSVFNVWAIPKGFQATNKVGTLVVPLVDVTFEMLKRMLIGGNNALSQYAEKLRVCTEDSDCFVQWVSNKETDAKHGITRSEMDGDSYAMPDGYYTSSL